MNACTLKLKSTDKMNEASRRWLGLYFSKPSTPIACNGYGCSTIVSYSHTVKLVLSLVQGKQLARGNTVAQLS
jgi:hypothetical protein